MKKIIYKTSKELKDTILPELEIYDNSILEPLLSDVKENGILGHTILSKDEILIDGFRLVKVAEILGIEKIPCLVTELEATVENRIALNNKREKTWLDLRNEMLFLGEHFGKKQGLKLGEIALGTYDRYKELVPRFGYRYKDPATIKNVLWILQTDIGDFPMSWWLLARNSDVKSIKELMDLSFEENHKEIYDRVRERKLNPKAALKEIELQKKLTNAKSKCFSLPTMTDTVAEIHIGEPEDVLVNLEDESVRLIFYEPEKYTYSDPSKKDYYGKPVMQTPAVYGTKGALAIKPFAEKRLGDKGSVIAVVHEAYHNGFAQRIPENFISAVEKETGLVYKQTLFQSDIQSYTEKKSGRNMPDTVTHLLWFVKTKGKETFHDPSLIVNKQNDASAGETPLSLAYMTCSNHLNNQSIVDMVFKGEAPKEKGKKKKGSGQPLKDPSAIIPIYMTTEEGDLVVDLTMKRDIESAAILMNRRFIGITQSKKVFDTAAVQSAVAIDSYDNEMVKKVFGKSKISIAASKRKTKQAA